MTFRDLLEACITGEMPEVTHETLGAGRVTVIKDRADGTKFKGCAVRFPQYNFDMWFHDSDDTDKRSKYLRELKLL